MSSDQNFSFASRNLVWLAVVCFLLSGCDSQPRAKRGGTQKFASQKLNDKATRNLKAFRSATKEPAKSTNDLENPKADDSKQEEADRQEKANSSDERSSRLDEAIKKLNAKEPVDIHTEEPVPEREIHEAIVPLVGKDWIRLHKGYEVWLDLKGKQVYVGGRISIHDGMLEMFACPEGTKDHESVISTVSNAEIIHAGLLASGAIAGRPARWMPEFVPAFGPTCELKIIWKEGDERKEVRAQEMILDLETGKTLESDWVFCGSKIWTDPANPQDHQYFADHGELISVSNFPTSMMDLKIESSNANAGLRFQANKEKIPAPGTPVLIQIKVDPSTNPSAEKLAAADIAIAEAERQLEEEYEKARQERKARMLKQKEEEEAEEEAKRNAERDENDNGK